MSQKPTKDSNPKVALIIGAGPAGLTAAYELLEKTDFIPFIVERSDGVGGLARTHKYKNNLIDTGGHRFFSKSNRVMNWWNKILPVYQDPALAHLKIDLSYQGQKRPFQSPSTASDSDRVMLIRKRVSHILHNKKFFDYPVSLNFSTIKNLGILKVIRVGLSYIKRVLFPIRNEKTLEDFFINRFGQELYETFFKDYTEKVWGVPCSSIPSEWGAQRIKGLSGWSAIQNALKKMIRRPPGLSQKDVETSLIQWFIYPKFGAGQMWEEVSKRVQEKGGKLVFNKEVFSFGLDGDHIKSVKIKDLKTGEITEEKANLFFSTMPIQSLVQNLGASVPAEVKKVAQKLQYRDFITVGVLASELSGQAIPKNKKGSISDTWIYVHEKGIKMGRVQVFNNWSPSMVADPQTYWLGVEYFCNQGDDLWTLSDSDLGNLAKEELIRLGFISPSSFLDSKTIRVPKAYPSYFGSYAQFPVIRDYLDTIQNLFPLGRNGMHRYNNQDHSMLTAMAAVDNVVNHNKNKDNIWAVNTEDEYSEEK